MARSSNLASNVLGELKHVQARQYPLYNAILKHAFDTHQPVFAKSIFAKRYAELSDDGEWFANQLVANSCLEGYGAQQIWNFSNKLDNDEYARRVRQHALDESRHSTMFISMLNLVYPGLDLDHDTLSKIDDMQPKFTPTQHPDIAKVPEEERLFELESINELVQVHITEIRALVLQYMVRDALLKHAPEESHARLKKFSDSLIRDEAKHINYSAEIFEDYASRGNNKDFFYQMFEDRLCDFNELTKIELEREDIEL
ncbi:hypothetical protein [Enterovibrio norvegicus]|uniref:Ferritin n=1 Tax=Enterovibrio norvegicus TaxID=188144 RepID=A0ABV4KZ72_9GAMM|nr:hypothetical protein [Enterovibrio norvegicus]OEF56779.1 hypothetical protein A1OU_18675 [Enterovibrio norvegicus]